MEVGATSQVGSFQRPWDWNPRTGINYQDQANYYASVCSVVNNHTSGMYPWAVDFNQDPDTIADDESFTPLGKPAEDVIRNYYYL